MDKRVNDELGRESKYDTVTENSPVWEIDLKARTLIEAADLRGWKVAADNLRYYLDGKGKDKKDKRISRNWLRGFRRYKEVERQYRDLCIGDILDNIRSYSNSGNNKPIKLIITNKLEQLVSYNNLGVSKEELFYASGDSWLKADVDFIANINNGIVTVTGKIQYHWHDTYDFHKKKGVLIPLLGNIPDKAMLKLEKEGKSRPFRMSCDYSQTLDVTTFKVDQWRNGNNIKWNWGLAF